MSIPENIWYAPPDNVELRKELESKAVETIVQARMQLLFFTPFFGELATHLSPVLVWPENWWNSSRAPTVATDGQRIFFNPSYVLYLTHDELCFVWCHEVLHVALGHIARLEQKDHQAWNMATDYVINAAIKEHCAFSSGKASSWTMPKGGLFNSRYASLSADAIYSLLVNKNKSKEDKSPDSDKELESSETNSSDTCPTCQGSGTEADQAPGQVQTPCQDCGGSGKSSKKERSFSQQGLEKTFSSGKAWTQMKPDSSISRDELHQDQMETWRQRTQAAWEKTKRYGSVPSGLDRLIDEWLKPKVDWRTLLHRFVSQATKNDYSWSHPNRRFIYRRIYLPSLHDYSLGEIVVVIDDSGSCYDDVPQFLGEVKGILDEFGSVNMHLVACDVDPYHVFDWKPGDGDISFQSKIMVRGGGGTSFVKPFDLIREKDWHPGLVVYLTDLDGEVPGIERDPCCPVLWVCNNDRHVNDVLPFGQICTFKELGD